MSMKMVVSRGQGSSSGDDPRPMNPFQKTGTRAPYEMKETKTGIAMRIDMPGAAASDLTCWVDGNGVNFFADEPTKEECDHKGRTYGGNMVFNPTLFNVSEAEVKLVNGVLWINVPKVIKNENVKINENVE